MAFEARVRLEKELKAIRPRALSDIATDVDRQIGTAFMLVREHGVESPLGLIEDRGMLEGLGPAIDSVLGYGSGCREAWDAYVQELGEIGIRVQQTDEGQHAVDAQSHDAGAHMSVPVDQIRDELVETRRLLANAQAESHHLNALLRSARDETAALKKICAPYFRDGQLAVHRNLFPCGNNWGASPAALFPAGALEEPTERNLVAYLRNSRAMNHTAIAFRVDPYIGNEYTRRAEQGADILVSLCSVYRKLPVLLTVLRDLYTISPEGHEFLAAMNRECVRRYQPPGCKCQKCVEATS
jgi:hypothetical protein